MTHSAYSTPVVVQSKVGAAVEILGSSFGADANAFQADGGESDSGMAGFRKQAEHEGYTGFRRHRAAALGRIRLAQRPGKALRANVDVNNDVDIDVDVHVDVHSIHVDADGDIDVDFYGDR